MVEFKICIQESMDEFEGRESWELRFPVHIMMEKTGLQVSSFELKNLH